MTLAGDGSWTALTGGRSGTTTTNPAWEFNDTRGCLANPYVVMYQETDPSGTVDHLFVGSGPALKLGTVASAYSIGNGGTGTITLTPAGGGATISASIAHPPNGYGTNIPVLTNGQPTVVPYMAAVSGAAVVLGSPLAVVVNTQLNLTTATSGSGASFTFQLQQQFVIDYGWFQSTVSAWQNAGALCVIGANEWECPT